MTRVPTLAACAAWLSLAGFSMAQDTSPAFVPPHDMSGAGLSLLLRSLESGYTPEERWSAAWHMSLLESPDERQQAVLPLFEAFVRDEDDAVRRFAGLALTGYAANASPPNLIPAHGKHFDDLLMMILPPEEVTVRTQAIDLLARMGDARATAPLLERLYDHFAPVRMAAARTVARLGDFSALKPLRERRDSAMEDSAERAVYEEAYRELIKNAEQTSRAIKAKSAARKGKRASRQLIINTPDEE
jgi:HEAT repeat protein